jgi:hypothetical protein
MTDPDLRAIFDGDAAQRCLYERRLAPRTHLASRS